MPQGLDAHWEITQDIHPGPNVISHTWNTSEFTRTYQEDEEYLMLVHWTDQQDNIIDSVGPTAGLW